MREKIVLSDRMQAVASFVTAGSRVCDVGCDHAFIPIYLVQQGISPGVIAMDIGEGPLGQAREHIAAYGLEEYIQTRLSDGLSAYEAGEADTLICAGMGGKLMMRILTGNPEKADSFQESVFQPQSEIQQFRACLRMQGYLITAENMIEDDGKFYPVIRAVKTGKAIFSGQDSDTGDKSLTSKESRELLWRRQMEDKYGPILLREGHPVLYRYLEREARICGEVLAQLEAQGLTSPKQSSRYLEVKAQRQDCLRIMEEIRYGNNQD